MADDHANDDSKRASRPATSSRSPDPPPASAVRNRFPQRSATDRPSPSPKPQLGRRRSSILSYSSIEDVTTALTDDFINPSMKRPRAIKEEDEVTHWHSTPLAFAILPAVGGLLFKNGSAFVTDILLLVLAAIFMNWSIRLPWDWYYSAQAQRRVVEPDYDLDIPNSRDETAVESASETGGSPKQTPALDTVLESDLENPDFDRREDAATELRRQEKLALLSTFAFPMLAAYLLHMIRAQLSHASTGLVSDYNLTIFLLAAEIRPVRQLVRLITNRTLHLQRTVTGLNDPYGSAVDEKSVINGLTHRLGELEAKVVDHVSVPKDMSVAQKTELSELSTEMRKRYEPRLEGLERAVRRYEKRSTTLAMLTEQRLGQLETRLQDALSLAAVAAQQSQARGAFGTLLDSVTALILLPMKLVVNVATSPLYVADEVYRRIKSLVIGPSLPRARKRSIPRKGGSGEEKTLKEKGSVRKLAR